MNVKKVFRAMTLISVVLAGSINLDAQTKASDVKASDTKADQKTSVLILSPEKISLESGKTQKITIKEGLEKADVAPTWKSSNEKVATVDKEGLVKAIAEGKATITATTGKKEGKCEVTVSKATATDIALDASDANKIKPGETKTIKVKSGEAVTWESSDASIATVDQNGKVTAKKNGKVTITATSKIDNKKKNKCEIVVGADDAANLTLDPSKALTLDPSKATIEVGKTQKITVKSAGTKTSGSNPSDAATTWKSSNEKIATVDKDGNVKGIAEGQATITATSDKKTGKCEVTVTKPKMQPSSR